MMIGSIALWEGGGGGGYFVAWAAVTASRSVAEGVVLEPTIVGEFEGQRFKKLKNQSWYVIKVDLEYKTCGSILGNLNF